MASCPVKKYGRKGGRNEDTEVHYSRMVLQGNTRINLSNPVDQALTCQCFELSIPTRPAKPCEETDSCVDAV